MPCATVPSSPTARDVTTADVVNAFEKNMADATYGAFLEFIDTVSAKDDKTVSFTLKYPFDSLLKGRLSVVKVFPASLTEDDLKTKPIGSGPWVYDTINGDDGGSIEFVPNTNYNGKYAATADKMHWDILLDDTSRTTALQEATVQVMENVPDANAEQLMAAGASVDYHRASTSRSSCSTRSRSRSTISASARRSTMPWTWTS